VKGVLGWLFQRVTGALLVAGLLIHFMIMHFSGPEQISHAAVLRRLSNPYWKVFDAAFLLSVIYHGFNGLWGLAHEYVHSAMLLRTVQASLLTSALLLMAVGIVILTL